MKRITLSTTVPQDTLVAIYPWGSGGNESGEPHSPRLKRSMTFLDHVESLKAQGLSDKEIADGLEISLTDLRARRSASNAEVQASQISMAQRLRDKGMRNEAIAERMGLPGESSVRALLAPGRKEKAENIGQIADMLKRHVDEHTYLDVGTGVETHITDYQNVGVSAEKLKASIDVLKQEGYQVHPLVSPQVGTTKDTKRIVLVPPGITKKDVWLNRDSITQITEFSRDDGRHFGKTLPPLSIHPDRVQVLYKEDGGDKADGVLYVREGVPDVSLGDSRYSQVRVKVGEGHYLKGMAVYKEGLPKGIDIAFNTVKSKHDPKIMGDKIKAMKPLEDDKDFPFGSVIDRQIGTDLGTAKGKVTSVMNIIREEGQWLGWSKNLSSQILSKQSPQLAKEQLDLTYDGRKKELDEINSLTNPAVKKKLLEKAADSYDAAAVHLKAATLSARDAWHVILPIDSMRHDEVHAPNYDNGEKVVLVRYPHGGTFELPELTVNNKNREAKKLIGDAQDAIGIHHSVAERLSGADFDGDTVLVIPNNKRKITTTRALEGLKGFDPVHEYPEYEGMKVMTKSQKQHEMGNISNLITDMTLQGAPRDHITRAIKHSMVVIDAEKKRLNWKQSAINNNIRALKEEYQGGPRAGASTLISRKKQETRINERRLARVSEGGPIDKQGRQVFVDTGFTRVDKSGKVVPKQQKINRLALTSDAHSLTSSIPGTPHEVLYANHSNKLKALANEARLTASKTPPVTYSSSAAKTYAKEVDSLNSKLILIKRNRPRERHAQAIAQANIKAIRMAKPGIDPAILKKLSFRELENARVTQGAKAEKVQISQEEWNAIQAGAIHNSKLNEILDKADLDVVKGLATPHPRRLLDVHDASRARQMLARGATRAEVAGALGVSVSTLDRTLA